MTSHIKIFSLKCGNKIKANIKNADFFFISLFYFLSAFIIPKIIFTVFLFSLFGQISQYACVFRCVCVRGRVCLCE